MIYTQMSQSHNPTDTQALLQSMLQRLKLQPGRDGQAYLHSPAPITAASTLRQDGERAAFDPHKVNSSPVSDFGVNGVPSKESGLSAVDHNFGHKDGKTQQAGHDCEVDSSFVSFSSQKDNNHGDLGEKRVMGKTPTGTGQLFPATSVKDADITSFQRTDGGRVSFGNSGETRHITPNTDNSLSMGPNQDQGFKPKVYMWSLKNTDADAGGQRYKKLHEGNGGSFAQSKDEEIVSDSHNTTSNSFRRKHRSSENKTRRWTQKIKERWKDRSGGFGKKEKGEGRSADQKSEHRTEISPSDQLLEKNDERSLSSQESSGPSTMCPARPEDSNNDGLNRSTSDFDFGLGSFSLLEEIVTGQEWEKFLNPNLSVTQRAPEEPQSQHQIQTSPHSFHQSSAALNPFGGGSNRWSFRSTEPSPPTVFGVAEPTDASLPISMDVSEGKQSGTHREAEQTELMEDMQAAQRRQTFTPPSPVEPADNLQNSALKSRVHLNRKRQHQTAESRGERLQADISEGAQTDRGHLTSSLSITSSHMRGETGESGCENLTTLYNLNCHPTPLSPSSSNPFPPARRGVLKHSMSQDSESSMETMTKRRRVEENRRVRFAEEVVAIACADVELDATDSEEDSDSGAEEDSMSEQDCVVEQAVIEEVVPSRRPVLTAWMRVLKRKNTGRKPRQ